MKVSARGGKKRGQTVIFILMAVVVLAIVFLWIVDLRSIISGKNLAQNGGDAAALAAARWQGEGLNLIGELNLMHAEAIAQAAANPLDPAALANAAVMIDAITNLQLRLCYSVPMTALVASQIAAKNNRIYTDEEFTRLIRSHAADVEQYDTEISAGNMIFAEPYVGAWDDYAAMLRDVAADGIAAAPDNAEFYTDSTGGHILKDIAFYEAVRGREWCWFFLNHPSLLEDFTDHNFWDPIPPPSPERRYNSEIFSLCVTPKVRTLRELLSIPAVEELVGADVRAAELLPLGEEEESLLDAEHVWFFFEPSSWRRWDIMHPFEGDAFPIAGDVKDEYDYTGADAVTRVSATAVRIGGAGDPEEDELVWTAAAKPFGYLEVGGVRERPDSYGLVLPAFRDARLIPLDASSLGSAEGSFNIAWRKHSDIHLEPYVASGFLEPGCRYCNAIKTFESADWRRTGVEWLSKNSGLCTLPSRPGGHRGGGTRRGH